MCSRFLVHSNRYDSSSFEGTLNLGKCGNSQGSLRSAPFAAAIASAMRSPCFAMEMPTSGPPVAFVFGATLATKDCETGSLRAFLFSNVWPRAVPTTRLAFDGRPRVSHQSLNLALGVFLSRPTRGDPRRGSRRARRPWTCRRVCEDVSLGRGRPVCEEKIHKALIRFTPVGRTSARGPRRSPRAPSPGPTRRWGCTWLTCLSFVLDLAFWPDTCNPISKAF